MHVVYMYVCERERIRERWGKGEEEREGSRERKDRGKREREKEREENVEAVVLLG